MVCVAVTPLTVHSPAAERPLLVLLLPVSSPLPILTMVHDHMHDASDWMYHYGHPLTNEDMYLWAEEYAKEQFPSGVSDSQHPKWNVDSSGKDIKRVLWKIAQEEIKAYRQRVKQLSGKEFKNIDPLKDVLQLYLGKARPLIQLMEFSLNLLHKKVMHFLGTYCVQKSYHLSVSELYDDEDNQVKTLDLMSELEYRAI